MLEKTILSLDNQGVDDDLAGISISHRKATGKELFGFYTDIAGKPEWKNDWERFGFKEFLDREFDYVKMVGLAHDERNRQITVDVKNEQGAGEMSSQWRRQAKLVVYVPKCGRHWRPGRTRRVQDSGVKAPVAIVGEGDRDYEASYEVSNLIRLAVGRQHRASTTLDGVKGDVSIAATAYSGNVSTAHDNRGITIGAGRDPHCRVSKH